MAEVAGRYEVRLYDRPGPNRVNVIIRIASVTFVKSDEESSFLLREEFAGKDLGD